MKSRTPFAMEDLTAPHPSARAEVHFVRVHIDDNEKLSVTCDGLTPEQLAPIVEAMAPWRDEHYVHRRLLAAKTQLGLRRMVVLRSNERYGYGKVSIPEPLATYFEPVPLRGQNEQLVELMDSSVQGWTQVQKARSPFTRDAWAYLELAFALVNALCVLFEMIGVVSRGFDRHDSFALLGIAAALLSITFIIHYFSSRAWYLIPGGAAECRRMLRGFGLRVRCYLATDSVLLITPQRETSGWTAHFLRTHASTQVNLTDVEVTALLAAWQYPREAPDIKMLKRWFGAAD